MHHSTLEIADSDLTEDSSDKRDVRRNVIDQKEWKSSLPHGQIFFLEFGQPACRTNSELWFEALRIACQRRFFSTGKARSSSNGHMMCHSKTGHLRAAEVKDSSLRQVRNFECRCESGLKSLLQLDVSFAFSIDHLEAGALLLDGISRMTAKWIVPTAQQSSTKPDKSKEVN